MCRCGHSPPTDVGDNVFLRRNGWQLPFHPLQFVAWMFLGFFCLVYFGVLVLYLPDDWRNAGYLVAGIVIVLHIILLWVCTTIDPAHKNVKDKGQSRTYALFDRTKQLHVIEDNNCCLCQVEIDPSSKHCSVCNKCVTGFDHHCKWLNNCVGTSNYSLFIGCLLTGIMASLFVLAVALYVFVQYFVDRDELKYLSRDNKFYIFCEVPHQAVAALAGIVIILILLALGLLGHLFLFHLYLMCHGWSTYDYIMHEREANGLAVEDGNAGKTRRAGRWRHNKVAPVPDDISNHSGTPTMTLNRQIERDVLESNTDFNGTFNTLDAPVTHSTPYHACVPMETTTADVTNEDKDDESLKEIPVNSLKTARSEPNDGNCIDGQAANDLGQPPIASEGLDGTTGKRKLKKSNRLKQKKPTGRSEDVAPSNVIDPVLSSPKRKRSSEKKFMSPAKSDLLEEGYEDKVVKQLQTVKKRADTSSKTHVQREKVAHLEEPEHLQANVRRSNVILRPLSIIGEKHDKEESLHDEASQC